MKNILAGILLATLASQAVGAPTVMNRFGTDTEVSDPVLIYTGNLDRRASWTEANLRPYVTHLFADGHRDWFHDAFIFNETTWIDPTNGETRVLTNNSGGQLPATQQNWNEWFDHIFRTGYDLDRLDKTITKWKPTLGEPVFKRHKVIIGCPSPCKDGRGTPGVCTWKKFAWGTVDGVDLDFSIRAHRVKAWCWAVDEIIRRFKAANFANLDLVGIYCPEEGLYSIGDIMAEVNEYIHSKGLRTYWIPYWWNNDQYALEYADYGFDIAYRQPNYFFYKSDGTLPPLSQLKACIRQSKIYGLGLELEVETMYTSNGLHSKYPAMHQRFLDYIDNFESMGVWAESGVAHYSGSHGHVDFVRDGDATDLATMDRLANIVAARQKTFSGVSRIELEEEIAQFAFASAGKICITGAPDAAVYTLAGKLVHQGNGTIACPAGIYVATDGHGHSVKVAVK